MSCEGEKNISNRAVFYKMPTKIGYLNLQSKDQGSRQEIRRQLLLKHQKQCRDAAFDANRPIFDEGSLLEDGNDNDNEEPMDIERKRYKQFKLYANKLMMSEWMLDVPEDLSEKWCMVPCPKGRRNLLVAFKGRTTSYSRRGEKLAEFNSALPGGNSSDFNKYCTLLDCIWVLNEKTYYVLDVLAWSSHSFKYCDADFRRFWLQSKFDELKELQLSRTSGNQYRILSLPSTSCNSDLQKFIQDLPTTPTTDGFLFYHRDSFYKNGFTPLVTWLKPFMLPEVLGISIPDTFDETPNGYIDSKQYISSKINRKNKTNSNKISMEIVEMDESTYDNEIE